MQRFLFVCTLMFGAGGWAADVSVSGHVSMTDDNKSIDVAFSSGDKAAIHQYYGAPDKQRGRDRPGKKTPPGLAKKGGLPPGIARHQRLPENVHYDPLPHELEARLSPLPSPNYVRVRIGQDFAILDKKTRVLLDVAIGLGG